VIGNCDIHDILGFFSGYLWICALISILEILFVKILVYLLRDLCGIIVDAIEHLKAV
jgi:hypothetical protein